MKQRVSRFVTRLSLVSVVGVAALGATACSNASPSPSAAAAEAQAAQAKKAEHAPGYRVFRQIESLDLRADQQTAVADIEETLNLDLAPHRETFRQVAKTLAAGVEEGKLDPQEAAAQQAALEAAVTDMRGSLTTAVNSVHDVLDAPQRAELVKQLQAKHDSHRARADKEGEGEERPLAKLQTSIGISDEQRLALRDAFRSGLEEVFPDRKARREAQEAKMKAIAEAFVSESFDAQSFDLGGGAEEGVRSFTEVANRAIAISGKVLTQGQRTILAELVRDRADAI